jgi:hypothetical protein
MKSKVATLAAMALTAGSAFSAVSLNFNAEFDTGVPQNLSNAAGVPTNGLIWGVLIDTTGNGLVTSNVNKYDKVLTNGGNLTLGSNYILNVAGLPTDDILYIATALTADTSGSTEGDALTTGGPGGIYDLNNIAFANGVGTGDKFYVVWFDGLQGGTLTDTSFTIPADGALLNYGEPFVGVDPNRNAGLAYVGTSGTSTGAGIAFVPEPSAALLGAFGVLGLLRRRRN